MIENTNLNLKIIFRKFSTAFLLSCFSIFISCKEMIPLPNGIKTTDSVDSTKSIATPLNVVASHGKKKQISLSWTPVHNAAYYFIYIANSPHEEYIQIDETSNKDGHFSLKVESGFSGYFKVAAVNALGEISDLSLASYGTSLATPLITGIEENEKSVTLQWYMENLNEKSYLQSIQFVARCYNPNGEIKDEKIITASSETVCTFDNMSSGTKYMYEVEAYLISDQSSIEKSLRLDAETAISLIPDIPEFSVTQGTLSDGVELSIKLPKQAKVQISNGKGEQATVIYEDRPIYFKIDRLQSGTHEFSEADELYSYVSFNGKTEKIPLNSAEFNNYIEGETLIFKDAKNFERGVKYDYRVRAYVDNFENANTTHNAKNAHVKTGWAAAIPVISTSAINYETATDDATGITKKVGASIQITSSWNALGRELDYYYLIIQNYKKLKSDNNDQEDINGTNSFIINNAKNSPYFDNFAELEDLEIHFTFPQTPDSSKNDSSSASVQNNLKSQRAQINSAEFNRGYYNYSLYIVPKSIKQEFENPTDEYIEEITKRALTFAKDPSTKLISNGDDIPTIENFSLKDGFKDKVELSFEQKQNTRYSLIRQTLNEDGEIDLGKSQDTFIIEDNANGLFIDNSITSGNAYLYTLYASNDDFSDIPSDSLRAYTLGTPNLKFESSQADYSTITVTWESVLHNSEFTLAKNEFNSHNIKYEFSYNGKTFSFLQNDCMPDNFSSESEEIPASEIKTIESDDGSYVLTCVRGKIFTLKILKNIAGFTYDGNLKKINAVDAGDFSNAKLKVSNDITQSQTSNFTESNAQVAILGPAQTGLTTSQATSQTEITITWNKIDGINNYAIRRIRPAVLSSDHEALTDIYIINSQNKVLINDEPISDDFVKVFFDGTKYTLKDIHQTAKEETSSYQKNQEKIAFGLEYEYLVFPIKKQSDNPFDENFEVEYLNNHSTEIAKNGFTSGYGINLVASKSDYVDKISVKWKKPNKVNSLLPILWYRKVGETTWKHYNEMIAQDKEEIDVYLSKEERADLFEFAINYDGSSSRANFEESFITYNKEQKDSKFEQQNVGYEFTLKKNWLTTVNATPENETFYEQIFFELWSDKNDSRKYKPGDGITEEVDGATYEIQVKNFNVSKNWQTVATISKDGRISTFPNGEKGDKNWYDVKIEPFSSNNGIKITPLVNGKEFSTTQRLTRANGKATAFAGTHNGLLKVQRDYKHYYRLVASRKNSEGDIIKAMIGNIDNTTRDTKSAEEIYAYRKISDDEFIKGITLIVADAVYQQGVNSMGNGVNNYAISGAEGRFVSYHQGGTKYYTYGTFGQNYRHLFRGAAPGTDTAFASGWILKFDNVSAMGAANGSNAHYFGWGDIQLKHDSNLPSYQGMLYLTAGVQGNLVTVNTEYDLALQYSLQNRPEKITIMSQYPNDVNSKYNDGRDGCYAADNNKELFQSWFPMQIGESISSTQKFDETRPIYQNTWWEERD